MARKTKPAAATAPEPARPASSLYPPAGAHWWSAGDHAAVVAVTRRLKARAVLEFGPGTSTLSLIEGGATSIDACEDSQAWASTWRERLQARFPGIVRIRPYRWAPVPSIIGCDETSFDLALVDGPAEKERRAAVIVYAMERCRHVLVPLEEGSGEAPFVRGVVERFASLYARPVEWIEGTGPLAGAFALIGPR